MIIDLIEKLFPWTSNVNSREQAKQRLKLVIAHDRIGLTPEMIESMRKEIMEVIGRYVDVDQEQMEFTLESNERMSALIANFPIRRVKPDLETE